MSSKIFQCSILNLAIISDILVDSKGNTFVWNINTDPNGDPLISLFELGNPNGYYHATDFCEVMSERISVNKPFSVVALPIDGKLKEFVALSLSNVVLSAPSERPKRTAVGFRPINWDSMLHSGLYVSRLHESVYSSAKRSVKSVIQSIGSTSFGDVVFTGKTGEYTQYNIGNGSAYNVSATRSINIPVPSLRQECMDTSIFYKCPNSRYIMRNERQPLKLGDIFRSGKFDTVTVGLDDGSALQARINYNFSTGNYGIEVIDTVKGVLERTGLSQLVDNISAKRQGDLVIVASFEIDPFSDYAYSLADRFCSFVVNGDIVLQFLCGGQPVSYDCLSKDIGTRIKTTVDRTKTYISDTSSQRLAQGTFISNCTPDLLGVFGNGDLIETAKHILVQSDTHIHVLRKEDKVELMSFSTKELSQINRLEDDSEITFVINHLVNITV